LNVTHYKAHRLLLKLLCTHRGMVSVALYGAVLGIASRTCVVWCNRTAHRTFAFHGDNQIFMVTSFY